MHLPSAGMIRFRFDGFAFASQPIGSFQRNDRGAPRGKAKHRQTVAGCKGGVCPRVDSGYDYWISTGYTYPIHQFLTFAEGVERGTLRRAARLTACDLSQWCFANTYFAATTSGVTLACE